MRILVLAPELPYPPVGGGKLRAYHLLRGLAERHTLDILCFLHDPSERKLLKDVRQWAGITPVLWTMPPVYAALYEGADPEDVERASDLPLLPAYFESEEMQARMDEALSTARYDAVYVITSMMGQFLPAGLNVAAAVDLWNLETLVQQRAWERSGEEADRIQWEKMLAYERSVFERCAAVFPVSSKEREEVIRLFAHPNVVNIDNGVDTGAYDPVPIPQLPRILFTGTMNYQPNEEGILYFLNDVWPLVRAGNPDATLAIVGQAPSEAVTAHHGGPVTVTGLVPKVQPYFDAARVCIVPLLSGGGTRLKILEAMAAGRPVVSTSLGAEGLETRDREHLLIADTSSDFAESILQILRDDALAASLARSARALVEERYDWGILVRRLERELSTISR
ncbi:MAG TPA: glycosyltransferase [Armatimonadota bacterium]|jgi:glycosyltransferase involved in cell wall biosynthesis